MHDYKSRHVAVMIFVTLVNTQTYTDRQTDRQTAFDQLYYYLSQVS